MRNTKEKYATEGYIDFIYGPSSVSSMKFMLHLYRWRSLYFHIILFHTVYPFFGEGEDLFQQIIGFNFG